MLVHKARKMEYSNNENEIEETFFLGIPAKDKQ